MILPNGALKVIDRKKNIFKLSQGEYVAPEKVEKAYVKYPFIEEIFVTGRSMERFCVGIVGVTEEGIKNYCAANGIQHIGGVDFLSEI